MLLCRLFTKLRASIVNGRRQAYLSLAAVAVLVGLSLVTAIIATRSQTVITIHKATITHILLLSSKPGGQKAVSRPTHRTSIMSPVWHHAIEVAGPAGPDNSGDTKLTALSCPSVGNCSAGGAYQGFNNKFQVFVVDEVDGIWHHAIEVPGTAGPGNSGNAELTALSCSSVGNCSAGGYDTGVSGSSQKQQAFVVDEVGGIWHNAIEVPGTAGHDNSGDAELTALSCSSAGNCSAGGYSHTLGYSHDQEAFVANEVDGIWHHAIEVPGSGALNIDGMAEITVLSCPSAGNCSAGGYYTSNNYKSQAFVANEVDGIWHHAIEVPGTAGHDNSGDAELTALSCSSVGNCSAGGAYQESTYKSQAFVVNEVDGIWHNAIEVPGSGALNTNGVAALTALSCPSVGNCSAGGYYTDASTYYQVFLANEVDGIWRNAIEVPGSRALNIDGYAKVTALSCPSVGNCSAGGVYLVSKNNFQVFLVNEVDGIWRNAIEVPGSRALNKSGNADISTLSCSSAGNCTAGGSYRDAHDSYRAFVVNEVYNIPVAGGQMGILDWAIIAVLLAGALIDLFSWYAITGSKRWP